MNSIGEPWANPFAIFVLKEESGKNEVSGLSSSVIHAESAQSSPALSP
jgi:hypothetical protein